MFPALQIIHIIISISLIVLIILQAKGGGLNSLFGGEGSSITKTRRGLEKTLFQLTIGLAVAFLALAIITVAFFPNA